LRDDAASLSTRMHLGKSSFMLWLPFGLIFIVLAVIALLA
jgi:hypothetical protein